MREYNHTTEYAYNLGKKHCESDESEPTCPFPVNSEEYKEYCNGFCERMEKNNYKHAEVYT